jgi:desulfoferrodoxin-like iron-binding protein
MKMQRREMLKTTMGLFATAAAVPLLAACGSDDPEGAPVNDAWETRASELEASQSAEYTAAAPGPWAGKEGGHVPSLTSGATATIETMHGQTVGVPDEDDHFITTLYVKDQDGVVIHLLELDGSEEAPTSSFTPPEGTTQMTAYSYCNLHGLWMSDTVTV